jgi:hypothetical protein
MAIFHLFESARMMLCRLTPMPAKSLSVRFPPELWRQVRRITPYTVDPRCKRRGMERAVKSYKMCTPWGFAIDIKRLEAVSIACFAMARARTDPVALA